MAKKQKPFLPDYIVTPGDILADYLKEASMTQKELSLRTRLTAKTINAIIKGKAVISPETATKLEMVFGNPVHFWLNLESLYQADRLRLSQNSNLEESIEWLKKLPINFMKKYCWISGSTNKQELVEQVLKFFGVDSSESFYNVWASCEVVYRQLPRGEISKESIFAWLRKGEIDAKKINLQTYDHIKFQQALHEIRSLTREENPQIFVVKAVDICASAGVAVVFVPEPPNTYVCGATRWIGGNPIIQLSLRYKTNDHLWFAFFHEAGHIIKHGRKEFFIEFVNKSTEEKEKEADLFASDQLIPPNLFRRFILRNKPKPTFLISNNLLVK